MENLRFVDACTEEHFRAMSLIHALGWRDTYRDLAQAASRPYQRAARSEIKILSAVDVKELQKRADRTAKELRMLDNTIQQTNWTADL